MNDLGVIYLAFGRPFLAMALASCQSLRATNPNVPACIITNQDVDPSNLQWWDPRTDHWVLINVPYNANRHFKTSIYGLSPFTKTLYLDCDTVVLNDVTLMSFFLEHFDIAARPTIAPPDPSDAGKRLFGSTVKFGDLPHWNGGVIGFRKNRASEQFFQEWNRRYHSLGLKRDQPALLEAMFSVDAKILSLDSRWNNADGLSTTGVLAGNRQRARTIIWHYKADIDRKISREILGADLELRHTAGHLDQTELTVFLKARSPIRTVHPRYLLRRALRSAKGRLPDIILSSHQPQA